MPNSSVIYSLSVVTYNRAYQFEMLVNSINTAYRAYPVDLEIIINNNNQGNDESYVSNLSKKLTVPFKIINGGNVSAGAARNQNIDVANGKYLVLVDDDVILDINYFRRLEANIRKLDNVNVIGFCCDIIRRTSKNKLDKSYLLAGMDHYFSYESNLSLAQRFKKVRWCPTANLVIKTDIAKASPIPIIDTIKVGGEDVIWGVNITDKERYFECVPEIIVYHSAIEDSNNILYKNILKKAFTYGRSEVVIGSTLNLKGNAIKLSEFFGAALFLLIASLIPYNAMDIKVCTKTIKSSFVIGNVYQSLIYKCWPNKISLTKLSQTF